MANGGAFCCGAKLGIADDFGEPDSAAVPAALRLTYTTMLNQTDGLTWWPASVKHRS